ncbi:MAG TPA: ABC transporter permease [Thermoanaerobaculia bacterium]
MNPLIRTHLLEIRYELLKALRLPAYSLPTLLFPVVFYLLFGVMLGAKSVGPVQMSEYLLATYGAFGVIGAALFGFGVSVAVERGQGWLEVKRTSPMPISAYFVAKLAMAMTFSVAIVILLFTTGILMGGATISLGNAAALMGILVTGSLTFCALGLALGFLTGPNSAAPIANLIYLPMGFLSGLWIPLRFLPDTVKDIALWLPPYHFSELALGAIGASSGEPVLWHVGALVVATILFLTIAWVGYRRDEGKTYG